MKLLRRIQRWWHERGRGRHHWRCVRVQENVPPKFEEWLPGVKCLKTPGIYEALLVCKCGATDMWLVPGFRASEEFVPVGLVWSDIEVEGKL